MTTFYIDGWYPTAQKELVAQVFQKVVGCNNVQRDYAVFDTGILRVPHDELEPETEAVANALTVYGAIFHRDSQTQSHELMFVVIVNQQLSQLQKTVRELSYKVEELIKENRRLHDSAKL